MNQPEPNERDIHLNKGDYEENNFSDNALSVKGDNNKIYIHHPKQKQRDKDQEILLKAIKNEKETEFFIEYIQPYWLEKRSQFLQRVGGGYRFIHRLLQEYFAEAYKPN